MGGIPALMGGQFRPQDWGLRDAVGMDLLIVRIVSLPPAQRSGLVYCMLQVRFSTGSRCALDGMKDSRHRKRHQSVTVRNGLRSYTFPRGMVLICIRHDVSL